MSVTDERIIAPDLSYGYNRVDAWHQLFFADTPQAVMSGSACAFPVNFDEATISSVKERSPRSDYELRFQVDDGEHRFDLVVLWSGYLYDSPGLPFLAIDDALPWVDVDDAPSDGWKLYVDAVCTQPSFEPAEEGIAATLDIEFQVVQTDGTDRRLSEETYRFRIYGDGRREAPR
jgi:hypothetical protein